MSRRARLRPVVLAVACATVCTGLGVVAPTGAHAAGTAPAVAGEAQGSAALKPVDTAEPERIPHRYIAIFDPEASPEQVRSARDAAVARGARIHFEYTVALRGFAASMNRAAVDALRGDPAVRKVDPDYTVDVASTQGAPSWGLDRVDQRPRPVNGRYDYAATGEGVTAYLIDTGIRAGHAEFGGRVLTGHNAVDDGRDATDTRDCNGHGTHVAGILGGARYGVAKQVSLVPVRVLGCDGAGSNSSVIAGIDWVTQQVAAWHTAHPDTPHGFVANMSLGAREDSAVEAAVRHSIDAGVTYVVAAGNATGNACDQSPAGLPDAITVGATDASDERASFSNYGSCVDLWAPGVNIRSAGSGSDTAVLTMTGTSMATPHAAGAAALYLQRFPASRPAQVGAAIVGTATPGVLHDLKGSVNKLLYTAALGGVPNRAPSANPPAASLMGGQAGPTTARVQVVLGRFADPDGDAVTHQLQRSYDGGTSWSDVGLPSARADAVTLSLPSAGRLRFRDRAVDALGSVGGWATGATRALALRDQGAASFAKSSKWKTQSVSGAVRGSVRRTGTKNSTATLKFRGGQVAWIATMARTRGKAYVYLDGKKVATVDLYRSSTSVRRLVFLRTGLSAGSHTLKVVVLGKGRTSKSKYVDVDGWITLG